MSEPLLETRNLSVEYALSAGFLFGSGSKFKSLADVSITVKEGETLGVVGESGCGKSTLAKALLRLIPVSGGKIFWSGHDVLEVSSRKLVPLRKNVQMVFQDPLDSFNPLHSVEDILREPLDIHRVGTVVEREARVLELLDLVKLPRESIHRYPHEFSGGQRQRIGIARALALSPKVLICDEPVSALDVSVSAQILSLLLDLSASLKMGMIFISHDLCSVKLVSDKIAVMYLGRVMEMGPSDGIYKNPRHPYTKALIASIPEGSKEFAHIKGEIPSPKNPPPGCAFHPRCERATELCKKERPVLDGDSHVFACHHPL